MLGRVAPPSRAVREDWDDMNADQPGFVPLSRKASGLYILSSGTFSACGSMLCPTTRQSQRRSYINPRIPPRQPQARVGHPLSWSLMPKTKTGRVGHPSLRVNNSQVLFLWRDRNPQKPARPGGRQRLRIPAAISSPKLGSAQREALQSEHPRSG